MGSISTTAACCVALLCDAFKIETPIVFLFFLFTIRAIVIALTNEKSQLARVSHQTDRQTAESIAGTEMGQSVATVSDADSRLGHPGWR